MTETPPEPAADSRSSDDDYVARLGLSEPGTTLGKLQRGRGAGWLECLELPREEAHHYLWQCIAVDPRLDQQVERRSEYYASLARLTDFDVNRLLPDELPPEEAWRDQRLVPQVLVDLDRAGVEDAGSVLLAQIHPEDDMHENVLLEMYEASEGTIARLPAALVERRNDEHLTGTVNRWFDEFPWESWAEAHPRIEAALTEVKRRKALEQPRPSRTPPPMSAPLNEILEYRWGWRKLPPRLVQRLTEDLRPGEYDQLLLACSERPEPALPFAILGTTNDPAGLAAATAITDEREPVPRDADTSYCARGGAAYRYFRALGPEHTLPLARDWLGTTRPRDGIAGKIFADHAEPADIPMVHAGLERAWRNREIYEVCDLTNALRRFPEHGPFEVLREIFEGVEYSYARWRTAEVMAVSDPTFGSTFARECLWDSDEGVQDAGIGFVEPDDSDAVVRVAEISALRLEEAAAREQYWSRRGRRKDS